MHLTDGSFSQQSIVAFQDQVDSDYQEYWSLVRNGTVSNGTFKLNDTALPLYAQQAAAVLGVANPSNANIQDYAKGLYTQLTTYFATNIGANWAKEDEFKNYVPNYSYAATSQQKTDLTANSTWTPAQLESFVDGAALNPSSGGVVGSATPNISGGDVTVISGANIGEIGTGVPVTIAALQDGKLTDAQVAAIATATAPGDVMEYGLVKGVYTQAEYGQEPAGFTLQGLVFTETKPLFVTSAETFDATASGSIYVQSTPDDLGEGNKLNVGDVDAGGAVSLVAPQGIYNAQTTPVAITSGGPLDLEASSGDVGTSAKPLVIQAQELDLADAGNNIYIVQPEDDLLIGRILADETNGTASLTASDGAIQNEQATALPITATGVILNASKGIGTSSSPIEVATPSTGSLVATANANVFIDGDSLYATSVTSANHDVTLDATDGDARIGTISAAGTVTVTASGSILNLPGQSDAIDAPTVTLTASGGTVGTPANPIDLSASKTTLSGVAQAGFSADEVSGTLDLAGVDVVAGDVNLTSQGAILTDPNFTTATPSQPSVAGGNITLVTTGGNIGSPGTTLLIDSAASEAGVLNATSSAAVYVTQTVGSLTVGNVTAASGDVRLYVPGSSHGGADLTVAGTGQVVSSRGNVILDAGNLIDLAAGSDVGASSGTATLTVDYLNPNANSTSEIDVDSPIQANQVAINGGTQSDTLYLQDVAAKSTVSIDLGGGPDVENVGSTQPVLGGNLATILGAIIVNGNGSDTLNIDDSGGTDGTTGTLTSGALSGLGLANPISYSSVTALTVAIGADNPFKVLSTNATTATTVSVVGTGTSTINVGSPAMPKPGVLSNIQGSLKVVGDGATSLVANDVADTSAQTATLTANRLTGLGMGPGGIRFSALGSVTVDLGTGADSVNVQGVAAGTTASVDTGGGADTIVVSSTAPATSGVLSTIQGGLFLAGHGNSTLNLGDGGDTPNSAGTLTDSTLTGFGMGASGITFNGISALYVILGARGGSLTAAVSNALPATTTIQGTLGQPDTFTGTWGGNLTGSLALDNLASQAVTVAGNLVGSLAVNSGTGLGVLQTLNVGGSVLAGSTISAMQINTLQIGGDLDATLTLPGNTAIPNPPLALGTATIGGTIPVAVTLSAGSIGSLTIGANPTAASGDNLAGTVTSGSVNTLADTYGEIAPTGVVNVSGNLGSLVVGPASRSAGQDMAGSVTVGGTLTSATIAGGTPGTFVAGHVGTIAAYGGFGPVVARITEAGVARWVEEDPTGQSSSQPSASATAGQVLTQYLYESAGFSSPQVAAKITNSAGTAPDQFDFSTVAFADGAKFNLDRLDASGTSGVGNVAVEGDLLNTVSAAASAFFAGDASPGGVYLPKDNLASVAVRDDAPVGSIAAKGIEAIAFGSLNPGAGKATVTGVSSTPAQAASLLAGGTAIVPAGSVNGQGTESFRVPFANLSGQQSALFVDTAGSAFDPHYVAFSIESNSDGVDVATTYAATRGAVTALVGWSNVAATTGLQEIDLYGDGGSINALLGVARSITSTGPLGDLNVQSTQGIDNITAPSIFGSITSTGPLYGTIQTTGLRTDPVTGGVSNVAADLGRVYVIPASGRSKATITTTAIGGGGGTDSFSGRIISRGNLLSTVRSDGGSTGTIAVAGDFGALSRLLNNTPTRLGGLLVNGAFSGQVVVLGNAIGDMTFNGGLVGGRVAVDGRTLNVPLGTGTVALASGQSGIVGNLTIDRSLSSYGGVDANSAIVSGGEIGDSTFGTTDTVQDGNAGIFAAKGVIAKPPTGGHVYNNVGAAPVNPNAAAIDAIFTNNGNPLELDLTGEDLGGLQLILTDLAALQVDGNGNLTGPKK